MSADLCIHVLDGMSKEDAEKFLSDSNLFDDEWDRLYLAVSDMPSVWVGEVSWLKALLDDSEAYVPNPVQEVAQIVNGFQVVDDQLIERVAAAMDTQNTTQYPVASSDDVVSFLKEHMGKTVFTVSW